MWSRCCGLVEAAAPGGADRLGAALDVGDAGAGQATDGAFGDDLGNAPHGVEIAVGSDRKAGLDDVDAHVLEELGQLEFFLDGHGCARRLLAIAHGGVENDDVIADVLGRGVAGRLLGNGHDAENLFAGWA